MFQEIPSISSPRIIPTPANLYDNLWFSWSFSIMKSKETLVMVETELRNLRLKASFINESHLFLTSPTSPTYITFHMEQACFSDGASRFHKKSNQTKTLSIGVD